VSLDHPREAMAAAEQRHGTSQLVEWCSDLITGRIASDDPDHPALDAVGRGSYVQRIRSGQSPAYWVRVWAARGLLYVWDDLAAPGVIVGLSDEEWRVREMCAKVCRLREIGSAGEELAVLVTDDVPRVRSAALRALAMVGEAEHAEAVRAALDDHDHRVAACADTALRAMSVRLDRDLG
jgi:hypothetical protein